MTSHPKTAGEVLGDHGPVEEGAIDLSKLVYRLGEIAGTLSARRDHFGKEWSLWARGHVADAAEVITRLSQPTKEGEGK